MAQTSKKSRYWSFLVYPNDENTPKLWLDGLIHTNLKFAVSPIHDNDRWTDFDIKSKESYCIKNNIKEGDLKKPHHHIIICYPNTTTDKNILAIIQFHIPNVNRVEAVSSVLGSYDYFTHKFNKDKTQYDESNIFTYNGFNIHDYYELSSRETLEIKKSIILYIIKYNIKSYSSLIDSFIDNEMYDELALTINNTIFFSSYIKSRYGYKFDDKAESKLY